MFLIADQIYEEGYDVYKFDEDEVAAGFGPGSPGEGIVYDEIQNAVNNRFVSDISIMGYSQGGGSTYNLSWWLDQQRQAGEIDPYSLVFTAYIDGVRDDGPDPEARRPINTQWHLNLYQDADTLDLPTSVLHGTSVAGANDDFNVETTPFGLTNITHSTIDDDISVLNWVELRFQQNVNR